MKWIVVIGLLTAGCVAPIDTHGVAGPLSGRCKLTTYQIDQTAQQNVRHGVIGFAIAQDNENRRRQEIYDACIEAGG